MLGTADGSGAGGATAVMPFFDQATGLKLILPSVSDGPV